MYTQPMLRTVLLVTACNSAALAQPSPTLVLDVPVTGFDNDRGHVIAALFRPGANVLNPKSAYRKVAGVIRGKRAHLTFASVPQGAYALVVFHDENDNGIVDHKFLRLPSEQLGFSNGFRPGLFAGLPTFEKLKFIIRPGATSVTVPIVVK